MNTWLAKTVVILASVAMIVIRAPHGHRSGAVPIAKSRKGRLETVLLTIAWIAFFVPFIWIVTPAFDFADYPLYPAAFLVGVSCLAFGLWLFHRSHADLGTNWSITLVVREKHQLITRGVYRWVRHPMYLSLLIYSAGQALVLPNWVAGPSYGVAMLLLFTLRMKPEERMMVEEFGDGYRSYMATTKRLIPGVW
jgi:protein-S-isoprenylcysteine O-methyltransferase Ste14